MTTSIGLGRFEMSGIAVDNRAMERCSAEFRLSLLARKKEKKSARDLADEHRLRMYLQNVPDEIDDE